MLRLLSYGLWQDKGVVALDILLYMNIYLVILFIIDTNTFYIKDEKFVT